MKNLSCNIGGLDLENPIMNASGCWSLDSMRTLIQARPDFRPGCIVIKGVTLEPRVGNKGQRIIEVKSGMINRIGLQNPGVSVFIRDYLSQWCEFGVPLVANVAGKTPGDICEVVRQLEATGKIAAYELNLSCPNVGGIIVATQGHLIRLFVGEVRKTTNRPLWVKLTPNVTEICEMAEAAVKSGADAVSLVNTVLGEAKDPVTGEWVRGGLSGPAIKPIALRMVGDVCHEGIAKDVIGIGGISNAQDAKEFLEAGAKAIAVGTANFKNPLVMAGIWDGLK